MTKELEYIILCPCQQNRNWDFIFQVQYKKQCFYLHSFYSINCRLIQVAIISMKCQCMPNKVNGVVFQSILAAAKKAKLWKSITCMQLLLIFVRVKYSMERMLDEGSTSVKDKLNWNVPTCVDKINMVGKFSELYHPHWITLLPVEGPQCPIKSKPYTWNSILKVFFLMISHVLF